MRVITSWDDGSRHDLKLAKLLTKHKIPATFYISGNTDLTNIEIIELSRIFNIGGHTETHPQDLKRLDTDRLNGEIRFNKDNLERIIRRKITDFAYPRGRYNAQVLEAVQAAGFKTARTTVVGHTTATKGPYRLPTTAHVYPSKPEYGGRSWSKYAWNLMERGGDFIHIWGHSWEIEKFGLWEELDLFLSHLRERVDIRELSI